MAYVPTYNMTPAEPFGTYLVSDHMEPLEVAGLLRFRGNIQVVNPIKTFDIPFDFSGADLVAIATQIDALLGSIAQAQRIPAKMGASAATQAAVAAYATGLGGYWVA